VAASIVEIAVDCNDVERVASFWSAALGWEPQPKGDYIWMSASGVPEEPDVKLVFARVPEPKTVKNRMHIDIAPRGAEQDEEVSRLETLGARRIDIGQGDVPWVVMADPEGNEFCVLRRRLD
jgi:predicted enzyme related to lactoylglutathione lyase